MNVELRKRKQLQNGTEISSTPFRIYMIRRYEMEKNLRNKYFPF